MDLHSMPLRKRLQIGFVIVSAVLGLMAVIVGVQYLVTYSGATRLQERLTPAAELTDTLLLAQSSASGDLSDYVLTERNRALTAHLDSVSDADALIRALEVTLEGDSALVGQLAGVRAAQQVWLAEDAAPTLAAMEAGDSREAARLTNRPVAWDSFDAMVATTTDFQDAIETTRNDARARVDSFARQLGWWLLLLAVALLAIMAAASLQVNSWVLRPLLSIRRDLGAAARGSHTHPIESVGPPELQALAADAEGMRRSLVAEIDEARAARSGLKQDAPLVAQMREAFQPSPYVAIDGLDVAATTSSAEGVLAGDWWDAITISPTRMGIVVGDTSGHGTQATITALRTRDLVRAALATGHDPADAITMASVACRDSENFVTAFVAMIDLNERTVTFANAGHLPAVIVTADKDTHLCEPTGPLMSSLGGTWTDKVLSFDVGDCLLAYTDGLTERNGADGADLEAADLSRAIRTLDAPIRRDASEVLARVVAHIRERSSSWQRDDVTAVMLTRPPMAL